MAYLLVLEGERAAIDRALGEHPSIEAGEDGAYVYENGATLSTFELELDDEGHLTVEVPYLRPFAFAEEVADFLEALCTSASLAVSRDPQIDGIEGRAFSLPSFLRGWLAGNAFAYRTVIAQRVTDRSEEPFPPCIPSVQLEAIWSWNRNEALSAFGGGCRVGLVQLAEDERELFTMGLLHLGEARPTLVPLPEVYALFEEGEPVRFVRDDDVRDVLDALPQGPDGSALADAEALKKLDARARRRGVSTLYPGDLCETELVEHAFDVLQKEQPSAALVALRESAGLEPLPEGGTLRTALDVVFAAHAGAHRDEIVYCTPTTVFFEVRGKDAHATRVALLVTRPEHFVVQLHTELPFTGAELAALGERNDSDPEAPVVWTDERALVEIDDLDAWVTRFAERVERLRGRLATVL